MEDQYYDIQRRTEIKDTARELRRKYLRYKDAELVYSIQHTELLIRQNMSLSMMWRIKERWNT